MQLHWCVWVNTRKERTRVKQEALLFAAQRSSTLGALPAVVCMFHTDMLLCHHELLVVIQLGYCATMLVCWTKHKDKKNKDKTRAVLSAAAQNSSMLLPETAVESSVSQLLPQGTADRRCSLRERLRHGGWNRSSSLIWSTFTLSLCSLNIQYPTSNNFTMVIIIQLYIYI